MANKAVSKKHIAISKANAQMVVVVGVASFISVFSMIASHSIYTANSYRSKVIAEKNKANKQLIINTKAYDDLAFSYRKFDNNSTNIIGGTKDGTGDNDGANSKIILDALPKTYDFPALTSSLEKIMGQKNIPVSSIVGTDDQVAQQTNVSSPSPTAVPMPFTLGITQVNYTAVQNAIATLEQSIRPVQIDKINISSGSSQTSMTVDAHTYYQPSKDLRITQKVVK